MLLSLMWKDSLKRSQFLVYPQWRLLIDSSSTSLKAVPLHKGSKLPSIPIAHSAYHKVDYDSVKLLLEAVQYKKYERELIGDFKMIAFLMAMQGSFTKYSCHLCLWNSQATASLYHGKEWPARDGPIVGMHNVKFTNLVKPQKIIVPPLRIKLGLL